MKTCRGQKKSEFSGFRNQRGQFAIEAVLLLAVLIGTFMFVTGIVKKEKMLTKLFQKPVLSLRNMTGFGTFRESCEGLGANKKKQNLSQCHPNSISRALSSKPE